MRLKLCHVTGTSVLGTHAYIHILCLTLVLKKIGVGESIKLEVYVLSML